MSRKNFLIRSLLGVGCILALSLSNPLFAKLTHKKYAVFVDSYSSGSYYPAEARKQGLIPIHIQTVRKIPNGYWGFRREDYDFNTILDRDSPNHESNYKTFLNVLKITDVAFVINGSDLGVYLADRLNADLNLRGNDPNTTDYRRDKFVMGEKAGNTLQALVKTKEEAVKWYLESDLKDVVVKVLKGGGSFGLRFVDNVMDLESTVSELFGSKDNGGHPVDSILLMERMVGTVYAVDSINIDGISYITEILRYRMKFTPHPKQGVALLYDYVEIVDPKDSIVPLLVEKDRLTKERLGFRNGVSHNEYFDTDVENTKKLALDSRIKLIEMNPRMVGAGIPKLAEKSTGQYSIELAVWAFTHPEEFKKKYGNRVYDRYTPAYGVSLHSDRNGKILDTKGFESLEKSLPSFFMNRLQKEGNIVPSYDLDTSLGMLFLQHPSQEQLEADYQRVRNMNIDEIYTIETKKDCGSSFK